MSGIKYYGTQMYRYRCVMMFKEKLARLAAAGTLLDNSQYTKG
ncbi:hypothetical protein NXW20_00105 [Bacteroides faecis]|nr:hypothetical protein [Bacteroides faecis]MCS2194146.1 hypothetical protein [Bacteroides faecis]